MTRRKYKAVRVVALSSVTLKSSNKNGYELHGLVTNVTPSAIPEGWEFIEIVSAPGVVKEDNQEISGVAIAMVLGQL